MSKIIIIGNIIYRHPNDLDDKNKQFIKELSSILSKLETTNSEVIIAGDYNITLLNTKSAFSDFFDMLTSHSFYPKITFSMRLTTNTGALIDNYFSKLSTCTLNSTSGILITKISEHQPYFTFLNTVSIHPLPAKSIKIDTQDHNYLYINFKIRRRNYKIIHCR